MNTRRRYEIKLLAERGKVDLELVAAHFDVSLRSVRYDIDALNKKLMRVLASTGATSPDGKDALPLEAEAFNADGSAREPITVRAKVASLDDRIPRQIVSALASDPDDISAAPLPAEERALAIVSMLCWSDDFITVQDFADEFQVSRATATRDLTSVYEYCEQNGLEIERSRGKGVRVTSDESVRRRVFARVVRDYRNISSSHSSFEVVDYLNWFPADELTAIADIVREAERESGLVLDDTAFEAIVIHVALSIKRVRSGIDYGAPLDATLLLEEGGTQLKMADAIISKVQQTFGVELPSGECYYIEVHMGARSTEVASTLVSGGVGLEFAVIQFIVEISRMLHIDLLHDNRLFDRLIQHIKGSIYRKKVSMLFENPMRDELLSSYAEHAQVVRDALERVGMNQYIVMTDDEVSYILLHVEAAIVNNDPREPRRPNVVVVCSTGFGTAELLAAEIGRYFDVNLIANIPAHQAPTLTADIGIDLVISTVPLSIAVPLVEVRPLLKQEDVLKISDALSNMGFTFALERANASAARESSPAAPAAQAPSHPAAAPTRETASPGSTMRGAQARPARASTGRMPLYGGLLCDYLAGHVVLDAPASTWQDAVRAAGQPLIATGAIDPAYVDAVIGNIAELGPYVVITKHVALPHAKSSEHVRRTSISCVRLAAPVAFGSKANDPVRYVFMLACADTISHTQALVNLANLLQTPEFMDVLACTQHAEDIVNYVSSYERSARDANGRG